MSCRLANFNIFKTTHQQQKSRALFTRKVNVSRITPNFTSSRFLFNKQQTTLQTTHSTPAFFKCETNTNSLKLNNTTHIKNKTSAIGNIFTTKHFTTNAVPENQQKEAPKFIIDGIKCCHEGNFWGAIEIMNNQLKQHEYECHAAAFKAFCYQKLEIYDKAAEFYAISSELGNKTATIYNNLGICFRKLENYTEALKAFDVAIALEAEEPSLYENKGITYDFLGEHEKAISCYDKAITLSPNTFSLYNTKANSLYLMGNYNEALKVYNLSLELAPSIALTHYYRGVVCDKLNDLDQALKSFTATLTFDPNYHLAYDAIGAIYLRQRDYDKALENFKKCTELRPNYDIGFVNMAHTLQLLGRTSESVSTYLSVMPRFPNTEDHVKRMNVARLEHKEDEAVAIAENYFIRLAQQFS